MASKKFKTYCKIIDYVDAVDSELADLLRGTCADMALNNLKGKNGITFLMPKDKDYIKKIAQLAYSDNVDDANKACDMLNALIIFDIMKQPSDWMDKKDDIPNALRQRVEVEGVTGKTVKFKSGATATFDDAFKAMGKVSKDESGATVKETKLAVWSLTGEIPVTSDKPATFKYAKRGKASKAGVKGSYEPTVSQTQSLRWQIALAVENTYMVDHLEQNKGRQVVVLGGAEGYDLNAENIQQQPRDAFLEYTMSFVDFLMQKGDAGTLFGKVLPLISFQKVDFYNIMEPHKSSGNYVIEDYLIREWWQSRKPFDLIKTIQQVGQYLENPTKFGASASDASCKLYSDRKSILTAIDQKRQQITGNTSRPRGIAEEISAVYEDLSANNRIGGLDNIYPADIANMYREEPGLKIVQDEMRYITYLMFDELEKDPNFDRGRFETLVDMIADYMSAQNGQDRERSLKLLNKNSLRYLIAPTEKVNEIRGFVNTTHFLYIPLSPQDLANFPHKYVTQKPDADTPAIFNIERVVALKHKRILQSPSNMSDDSMQRALSYLLSADPNSLPASVKNALKEAAGRIGQ